MLKTGTSAPNFTLQDQDKQEHALSDYMGNYVLIYFYPKDDTPGCTTEACFIRDVYDEFEKLQIKVFGISKDSPISHKKFAEKYALPFTLLSDPEKKIMETYQALAEKSMFGKKYLGTVRCSYLIDPKGKIVKTYPKVDLAHHAEQILSDMKNLV